MMTGLNHITLAVTDIKQSVAFYRDRLGFSVRAIWPEGACLEMGRLWLCLSPDNTASSRPHADDTHLILDRRGRLSGNQRAPAIQLHDLEGEHERGPVALLA